MRRISKRILLDETKQPIAVQIDYKDWVEIERALGLEAESENKVDLSEFSGQISLSEDPLEYQTRTRGEWP